MPASLANKLQLRQGQRLAVLHLPVEGAVDLDRLPLVRSRGKADALMVFVSTLAEVKRYARAAAKSMPGDGLFWVAYPKGTSGMKSDVNRDRLREALDSTGWRPVRLIAIDATWSAMRFRPAAPLKK